MSTRVHLANNPEHAELWRDYRLLQTTKEALEACRTTEIIAIRLQSLNAGRIGACRRTQRGKRCLSRVYFPEEEPANASDPVMQLVPVERRHTLVGRRDGAVVRFDIRLQGEDETVFFAR